MSVFPDEIYAAPRSWAERAYPKLIHYNRLDKGGHFAAWEQPELFTAELRAAFRPLRQSTWASGPHGGRATFRHPQRQVAGRRQRKDARHDRAGQPPTDSARTAVAILSASNA